MKKPKITPAQQAIYDKAHEERLKIINKPFPCIRTVVSWGLPWAGCLVPRPFDGMFLSQREVVAHLRDMRDKNEGRYDFAYDHIEL